LCVNVGWEPTYIGLSVMVGDVEGSLVSLYVKYTGIESQLDGSMRGFASVVHITPWRYLLVEM